MAEFFKPSRKIVIYSLIIFAILFTIQLLFSIILISDAPKKIGIPLTFYETGCHGMPPIGEEQKCVNNFLTTNLLLDILSVAVFSYCLSYAFFRKD
jgi:hypothetical protein